MSHFGESSQTTVTRIKWEGDLYQKDGPETILPFSLPGISGRGYLSRYSKVIAYDVTVVT